MSYPYPSKEHVNLADSLGYIEMARESKESQMDTIQNRMFGYKKVQAQ